MHIFDNCSNRITKRVDYYYYPLYGPILISYGTADSQVSQILADRQRTEWLQSMDSGLMPGLILLAHFLVLVLFFFSLLQGLSAHLTIARTCFHRLLITVQVPLPRKFYFCWFRLPFQRQPALPYSLTVPPTIPLTISILFSLFGQSFQVCRDILSCIPHFFAFLLLNFASTGSNP